MNLPRVTVLWLGLAALACDGGPGGPGSIVAWENTARSAEGAGTSADGVDHSAEAVGTSQDGAGISTESPPGHSPGGGGGSGDLVSECFGRWSCGGDSARARRVSGGCEVDDNVYTYDGTILDDDGEVIGSWVRSGPDAVVLTASNGRTLTCQRVTEDDDREGGGSGGNENPGIPPAEGDPRG